MHNIHLLTKTCFCALYFAINLICCLFHVVEHERGIQHKLSSRLLGESFPLVITQISFSIQHLNSILSCAHKLCSSFRVPCLRLMHTETHRGANTVWHSNLKYCLETKEHFSRDSHLRFKAGDHTTFPGVNVSLIVFI